jgi:SAM-dependent methyltransferase
LPLAGLFTPSRRRGIEILDDPAVDDATRRTSIDDVARANALLGGRRAAIRAFDPLLSTVRPGTPVTLLDVGTGSCDIAPRVASRAAHRGVNVSVIGCDLSAALLKGAADRCSGGVFAADAVNLPLVDRSVDFVICSQLLHHFTDDEAPAVVAELDRVARIGVVVSDLRRSLVAAAGFWMVSVPLRFHPVTRHDGVVSVMRGFTAAELRSIVRSATGREPVVRRHLGWRLTAAWRPT